MKNFDVIIIGGGPAGLTSAIYALRKQLKVLMIAKAIGGQAAIAHEVENWPGTKSISGFDLTVNMLEQAKAWGLEQISAEVSLIEKTGDNFTVKIETENYEASAVILTFGLTPRDLGVPGEKALIGKGVSYCATCDGPFFKNKTVAVIGGGNSALEAVEYLSHLATKVYLVSNTCKSSADESATSAMKQLANVEVICGKLSTEIVGENKVAGMKFKDAETSEESEIAVDGVFIEIGFMPKSGWLKGFVDMSERGEVLTNKVGKTSVPGIFAAGDCSDVGFKQIIIASGEGAKAALSAYKYIAEKRGLAYRPDYGHSVIKN